MEKFHHREHEERKDSRAGVGRWPANGCGLFVPFVLKNS